MDKSIIKLLALNGAVMFIVVIYILLNGSDISWILPSPYGYAWGDACEFPKWYMEAFTFEELREAYINLNKC